MMVDAIHYPTMAYYDGRFLPLGEPCVALAARSVRFGDGVFETMRVVAGEIRLWELHRARLLEGLRAMRIVAPDVELGSLVREVIRRNGMRDGVVRLAVTRAGESAGYRPLSPGLPGVVSVEPRTMPVGLPEVLRLRLVEVRRARGLSGVKHCQGVASTLALMEAAEHGCDEALMLSEDGRLCEAASANLWWVKDGVFYTPHLATGALPGVMRARVMRLAPVVEGGYGLDVLRAADAVFLTNAVRGVMPVGALEPMGWHWKMIPEVEWLRRAVEADDVDSPAM